MNGLLRWFRFNLVGALGMALQLLLLAGFNHLAPRHPLVTSSAAIEITLLHNFRWHMLYTWRDGSRLARSRLAQSRLAQSGPDRPAIIAPANRLLRFHLSNGVVSLLGNLLLLPLFLRRFPLLLANGAAILLCSVFNFSLGDQWVFAAAPSAVFADRPESGVTNSY
jgi:putative flippase GtrA